MFMLFLILLGGGIISLPFFILDQIAYYTILIILWYELFNVRFFFRWLRTGSLTM
jgi:hypothetical protein